MSKDRKRQQKIEEYDTLLNSYVVSKDVVKIKRTVTEGEADIYGIIVKNENEFLHVVEEDNFQFISEIIIKKDHFDSIRCNKSDKTTRKILKEEGLLNERLPETTAISLSSWAGIFEILRSKDIHVIIECEDLKKPILAIGSIQKIKVDKVELGYYNSKGRFKSKPINIKYSEITLLKFNDRYSRIFRKYLKQPRSK